MSHEEVKNFTEATLFLLGHLEGWYWTWQDPQIQYIHGSHLESFSREVSGGGNNIYNLMSDNEKEVVKCLNENLTLWSRQNDFYGCKFAVNCKKTYPDIFFKNSKDVNVLGLEVKSWNVLRSRSPSIEHGKICKEMQKRKNDILIIVPWFLEKITTGKIVFLEPGIFKVLEISNHIEEKRFVRSPETISNLNITQPWIKTINEQIIWANTNLEELRELIKLENPMTIQEELERYRSRHFFESP